MTVKRRYKGLLWQVVIGEDLAAEVDRYVSVRRAQESYRSVSRNEVLCELIVRGLAAARGTT